MSNNLRAAFHQVITVFSKVKVMNHEINHPGQIGLSFQGSDFVLECMRIVKLTPYIPKHYMFKMSAAPFPTNNHG